jgi:uncharacterized protein YecE (DUF72 family)
MCEGNAGDITFTLARRGDQHQGTLFGPSDPPGSVAPAMVDAKVVQLGKRLPDRLYLGTSTWSFPGWRGIVYRDVCTEVNLAREGIGAYAAHPVLRTVGLDRAFYRPPAIEQYRDLYSRTPPHFRFMVKGYQGVTRPTGDEYGRVHGATSRSGTLNPLFLDAQYAAEQVVLPAWEGLGEKLGVLVFQFPPLDLRSTPDFIERLHLFARSLRGRIPGAIRIAIELRNSALIGKRHVPRYRDLLQEAGFVHAYAGHPTMPGVLEQHAAVYGIDAGAIPELMLVRWMLRGNHQYDEAKDLYAPFDALVEEDTPVRDQITSLALMGLRSGKEVMVIVNNKAEGSAPLSCMKLAEAVCEGLER